MDTRDYFAAASVQTHGDDKDWSCVLQPGRYRPNHPAGTDVGEMTDEEFQAFCKSELGAIHREATNG